MGQVTELDEAEAGAESSNKAGQQNTNTESTSQPTQSGAVIHVPQSSNAVQPPTVRNFGVPQDLCRDFFDVNPDYAYWNGNASMTANMNEAGTQVTSWTAQYNRSPERERCDECGKYFENKQALDGHRAAWTYPCARCQQPYLWCRSRYRPSGTETYCRAIGGCVKHFLTEDEMFDHSEEADHKRCYYEDCKSNFRTRMRNDTQQVLNHILRRHGG